MPQKGEEKIDSKYFTLLLRVLDEEPTLPVALRALNYEREKKKFLKNRSNPEFKYQTLSPEKYLTGQKILDNLTESLKSETNEALGELYISKVKEFRMQLELRRSIGIDQKKFFLASESLYGKPTSADFKIALSEYNEEKELKKIAKNERGKERKYEAPIIKEAFTRAMEIMGIKEFEAVIEPKAKWIVINTKHKAGYRVEIPPRRRVTLFKLEELVAHEIIIHLGRGRNGQLSRLALLGFMGADHYGATEEGFATFAEQRVAIRRGRMPKKAGIKAALALGAALEGRNFKETFEFLEALGFSNFNAWKYTYRVFRGISDTSKNKGEIATLDWNYRRGNLAILDLVAKKGESILDNLYVGKIGIHHLNLMKKLKITNPPIQRKYLTIEKLLPELFK